MKALQSTAVFAGITDLVFAKSSSCSGTIQFYSSIVLSLSVLCVLYVLFFLDLFGALSSPEGHVQCYSSKTSKTGGGICGWREP